MENGSWNPERENRWNILADNPYFKQEVEEARLQLGTLQIPEDVSLGWVLRFWAMDLHRLFPAFLEELLEGKIKPEQQSRQWISAEAPRECLLIYAHSSHLIKRFNLPERWQVFGPIAYYLTSGEFTPEKYAGKRPEVFIIDDSSKKLDNLNYWLNWHRGIAFKIDEYITEKEVCGLWEDVVKVRDRLRDATGIKPPHHRRTGKKWGKRLAKWLEWYKAYRQADSIDKALNKLSMSAEAPPTETFKYAIKEIDNLMRPARR